MISSRANSSDSGLISGLGISLKYFDEFARLGSSHESPLPPTTSGHQRASRRYIPDRAVHLWSYSPLYRPVDRALVPQQAGGAGRRYRQSHAEALQASRTFTSPEARRLLVELSGVCCLTAPCKALVRICHHNQWSAAMTLHLSSGAARSGTGDSHGTVVVTDADLLIEFESGATYL